MTASGHGSHAMKRMASCGTVRIEGLCRGGPKAAACYTDRVRRTVCRPSWVAEFPLQVWAPC